MGYYIDKDRRGYYLLLKSIGNQSRYCKILGKYHTYEQALDGINHLNEKLQENIELIITGLRKSLNRLEGSNGKRKMLYMW